MQYSGITPQPAQELVRNIQQSAQNTLAPPGPRLGQISQRLDQRLGELAKSTQNLSDITNRICGSIPETPSKAQENYASSSALGAIEWQIESFGQLLADLHSTIARLEAL